MPITLHAFTMPSAFPPSAPRTSIRPPHARRRRRSQACHAIRTVVILGGEGFPPQTFTLDYAYGVPPPRSSRSAGLTQALWIRWCGGRQACVGESMWLDIDTLVYRLARDARQRGGFTRFKHASAMVLPCASSCETMWLP